MIKGKISHMQSQNEYAYCLGNPLLYVDRDGKTPTPGEGVVGGASWLGACDDDGNLLYSRGMMEAEMKKGKLAMFCGYALCFVLFFVLINETALVVNNVKYIIMLIILGYSIVALLKLPEEKKKIGYWLVFCIVMGSVGYINRCSDIPKG